DQQSSHQLNQLIIRNIQDNLEETTAEATITSGVTGPIYCSLLSFSQGKGCPRLVQEVTLYSNIKRIELSNRLLKDATPFQELYFAFPFMVDKPKFRFEGTNSVMRPFIDQFPGSNTNHYSVQHWAEVSN